ncbi:MAG: indolepyruvate ferredoxin oxidoreductase [Spirochaetaceae bacterium 4572_59]|nr:MAG: indolepyruvate ferredoxin oxidoreductase [Spirochaetaceae bacterium 4572_59]
MSEFVVLGDEAVALGAIHGGVSSCYGYPGTPSTEVMEYLLEYSKGKGAPFARWSSNEKTALEEGLGTSFAGKRAIVTMKHVGLNVAADAFMNGALLDIKGGLVIVVADDPGMHSSQNEQDSRFFADFAKVMCLEPVNQQQAYDMTREAFDLSEKFNIPVVVRLVTRLSHSRASIVTSTPRAENPLDKALNKRDWILLPANARRRWDSLLTRQKEMLEYTEFTASNPLKINKENTSRGVITTGLGYNYFMENASELADNPSHLHIGAYPIPEDKIRALADCVDEIVILEEGYPFVERLLRGLLPISTSIKGKMDDEVPMQGELTPDNIRPVLGLAPRTVSVSSMELPGRPPQLCMGCPHDDTFRVIKEVQAELDESTVTSDIGCYALAALPPLEVPETIICMGASITAAKGASEAGLNNVMAVIGDSTFLHSGLTGLVDCVSCDTDITIIIVDNETTAMTGGQDTILPSSRLENVVRGFGVEEAHLLTIPAHRKFHEENKEKLRKELSHKGVSVIIAVRECVETARKVKKKESAS